MNSITKRRTGKLAAATTALALVGTIAATAWFGSPVPKPGAAVEKPGTAALSRMSHAMMDEIASARSVFVLGVARNVELDWVARGRLEAYAVGDASMGREYFLAGVEWQEEMQLSEPEIQALAAHVIMENEELGRVYHDTILGLGKLTGNTDAARSLASVAVLRGMLDASRGAVILDPGIESSIDRLMLSEGPDAARFLRGAALRAGDCLATEAQGNGRLFASLQKRLSRTPEAAGHPTADANSPEVALDPFLAGIAGAAPLPTAEVDPFASGVRRIAEGPSLH